MVKHYIPGRRHIETRLRGTLPLTIPTIFFLRREETHLCEAFVNGPCFVFRMLFSPKGFTSFDSYLRNFPVSWFPLILTLQFPKWTPKVYLTSLFVADPLDGNPREPMRTPSLCCVHSKPPLLKPPRPLPIPFPPPRPRSSSTFEGDSPRCTLLPPNSAAFNTVPWIPLTRAIPFVHLFRTPQR